jgi:RNA polymerase sigma factor (sigma-70 family)
MSDRGAEGAYVREVYAASYRRLVTQTYAFCGDAVDAEDAVQEAFARALGKSARFRTVDNPEAWLRVVALNLIRRKWRRAKMFGVLAPKLTSPVDVPGISENHVAVMDALRSLSPDLRLTVALHYLGDLSVDEISAQLGVPTGTVKSRLSRGRDALASLLESTEEVDHA